MPVEIAESHESPIESDISGLTTKRNINPLPVVHSLEADEDRDLDEGVRIEGRQSWR
jgi:hypothetical protein